MMPDIAALPLEDAATLADAWRWCRQQLPDESDAALVELFDRGLSVTPTALRAFPERRLDASQTHVLNQLVKRRSVGEPLAYVLGKRGFWTLDLQVDQYTLIPRVETERLVEIALARIPTDRAWVVADLGTGSGAIALALAAERPLCRVVGIDRSLGALRMAKRNGIAHDLQRVTWLLADWLSAVADGAVDLLVSNPPYIAESDPHLTQGDLRFEPRTALSSGPDGLDDIRHLVQTAPRCLRPGGWLLFEHGYDQGAAVRRLLAERGFNEVTTEQDLEQRDRVSLGRWPS